MDVYGNRVVQYNVGLLFLRCIPDENKMEKPSGLVIEGCKPNVKFSDARCLVEHLISDDLPSTTWNRFTHLANTTKIDFQVEDIKKVKVK